MAFLNFLFVSANPIRYTKNPQTPPIFFSIIIFEFVRNRNHYSMGVYRSKKNTGRRSKDPICYDSCHGTLDNKKILMNLKCLFYKNMRIDMYFIGVGYILFSVFSSCISSKNNFFVDQNHRAPVISFLEIGVPIQKIL